MHILLLILLCCRSSCRPRPAAQHELTGHFSAAVHLLWLVQQQRWAGGAGEQGPVQRRLHLQVWISAQLRPHQQPLARSCTVWVPCCCCRPNGFYNMSSSSEGGSWWSSLVGQLLPGKKHRKVAQLELVRGGTVLEARQVFSNWATLVTR